MPAFTANLNLYLPGGGSLGIGGADEAADIDKLNQNFQAIDAALALASGTEVNAGTDPSKLVTPAALQGKVATNAEIDAGTLTTKLVSPAGLKRAASFLGIATKTTGDTTTNSSSEVTVTTISLEVTTPRAGNVRLTVTMPSFSSSLSDVLMIRIKEGTDVRAEFNTRPNSSTTATGTTQYQVFSVVLTGVTAGAHTYQLRILRPTGSGTITVSPSALAPVQLTAEMMG